jgi:hypothetical protein
MDALLAFQLNRRQVRLAIAFLFLVTLACGCFLDRSGTVIPVADFRAVPRLFCEGDTSQTTVSWNDEPQYEPCTDSPSLTGCDAITEYLFGCPEPVRRCKEVELGSSDASHDTAIDPDELSGDRTFLISVETTFSLTHPRGGRELASPVSVGFYNGIPDDDVSEDQFTIPVTCSGSDPLDLKEIYDSCFLIAQVCNRNEFDIMVNWDSNISPSPVRLAPRECLPLNIMPENISAFEVDRLGQRVACSSSAPGDVVLPPGAEEPVTDLNDIVLGVQKGGCGFFDEALGECVFTASEPIVAATEGPTPTDLPDIIPLSYPMNEDTLCTEGPGNQYNVVSNITAGIEVELLGIGAIEGWWVINNPRFNRACWIPETAIDVHPDLDLGTLQVFEPPPLPTATFTPAPVIPNAPSNLTATETVCNGGYTVLLSWDDNSSNEAGFRIYRDGSPIATVAPNVTEYSDNPPGSGSHTYRVGVFNAAGSAFSNEAAEDGCLA